MRELGMPDSHSELRRLSQIPQLGVSRDGRILGPSGKWLKASVGKNGYPQVTTYHPTRRWYVHQLVALAYHGNPPSPEYEVAHLNGNRTDNRAENLAWKTRAGNMADCVLHGTRIQGERHKHAKLAGLETIAIRDKYASGLYTQAELGRHYGVTPGTISCVVTGRTWKHIDAGEITPEPWKRRSKLTDDQRSEICRVYALGSATQAQLARRYGITQGAVSAIIRRSRRNRRGGRPCGEVDGFGPEPG